MHLDDEETYHLSTNLDYKAIYEKYIKPEKELPFCTKLFLSAAKSFC